MFWLKTCPVCVHLQASAKALRQRAAGIAVDTAFLEDKEPNDATKGPEEEQIAAEELYNTQLAKELRVHDSPGPSFILEGFAS